MHTKLAVNVPKEEEERDNLEEIRRRVVERQTHQKEHADIRRAAKNVDFDVNGWVRVRKPQAPKGEGKFGAPRRVIEKVGQDTYVLDDEKRWHANRLADAQRPEESDPVRGVRYQEAGEPERACRVQKSEKHDSVARTPSSEEPTSVMESEKWMVPVKLEWDGSGPREDSKISGTSEMRAGAGSREMKIEPASSVVKTEETTWGPSDISMQSIRDSLMEIEESLYRPRVDEENTIETSDNLGSDEGADSVGGDSRMEVSENLARAEVVKKRGREEADVTQLQTPTACRYRSNAEAPEETGENQGRPRRDCRPPAWTAECFMDVSNLTEMLGDGDSVHEDMD